MNGKCNGIAVFAVIHVLIYLIKVLPRGKGNCFFTAGGRVKGDIVAIYIQNIIALTKDMASSKPGDFAYYVRT